MEGVALTQEGFFVSFYEYVGLLLLHVIHWMQTSIRLYNFGALGVLPWNEEE